jgi:hypothetical protein
MRLRGPPDAYRNQTDENMAGLRAKLCPVRPQFKAIEIEPLAVRESMLAADRRESQDQPACAVHVVPLGNVDHVTKLERAHLTCPIS